MELSLSCRCEGNLRVLEFSANARETPMAYLSSVLYSCALLLLLNFVTSPCSHVDGVLDDAKYHHDVSVESLLPGEVCTPSKDSDPSKLEVVHRHGPCSPLQRKHRRPNHIQTLDNDHHRVDWIRAQVAEARATALSKRGGRGGGSLTASKIPVQAGTSLFTGNYIVTVGFGTPKVTQSVVFDTGSDVTWIQCQPCVSACYQQQDQLFDPAKSSTYVNISCSSPYCSALRTSGCSGSTCLFGVRYVDKSQTVGFFAQDTLSLSPSDTVPGFRFGCGEQNSGLFGRAAGLMGLGRNPVSLVMQAAQKYGGVFSYCLPATSSSTGYLSFGGGAPSNVQFTPMLTESSFYVLGLASMSVGGQKLALSPSLFSTAGVILDSGTVITRLPPTAYSALRDAFRKGMSSYPPAPAPASSLLDTCYDLSNYTTVRVPAVSLQFSGATNMNLYPQGILYTNPLASTRKFCLGFAPNSADTDPVIIGNTQQRKFNVVYDVTKKQIGFGPGSC